jgi:hypothetical protein
MQVRSLLPEKFYFINIVDLQDERCSVDKAGIKLTLCREDKFQSPMLKKTIHKYQIPKC